MDNPFPDVPTPDTALFFAVTTHIRDGTPDDLNDCWCTLQQLHTPFAITPLNVKHNIVYSVLINLLEPEFYI